MGVSIKWAFASFEYLLAILRKDAGESGPHNDTGALKEQNHTFAERFKDGKRIGK